MTTRVGQITEAERDAAVVAVRARLRRTNPDLIAPVVERVALNATQGDLPIREDGRLDPVAFATRIDEARIAEETYLATIAETAGVGSVRGVGAFLGGAEALTDADAEVAVSRTFGRRPGRAR